MDRLDGASSHSFGRLAILSASLILSSCTASDGPPVTDRTKRDALVRAAQAMSGSGSPLIPIAEFFDGNGDMASIAPNLITHPGIPAFREVFHRIEQRPNVASVWAHVDLEWEAYPGDDWPFASQVFVITSAGPDDVDDWVAELDADPCFTVEASDIESIGAIPTGYRVVSVWWD